MVNGQCSDWKNVTSGIKIKIKIKKPYLTSLIIFNRQH